MAPVDGIRQRMTRGLESPVGCQWHQWVNPETRDSRVGKHLGASGCASGRQWVRQWAPAGKILYFCRSPHTSISLADHRRERADKNRGGLRVDASMFRTWSSLHRFISLRARPRIAHICVAYRQTRRTVRRPRLYLDVGQGSADTDIGRERYCDTDLLMRITHSRNEGSNDEGVEMVPIMRESGGRRRGPTNDKARPR